MDTAGNIGGLAAGDGTPHDSGDAISRAAGGFPPPRGYALSGKIMLSAVIVLFVIVLIILFTHLYVRWHLLRLANRRRNARRARLHFAPGRRSGADSGLDPAAFQSIPVLAFSSKGADGGEEVVVECAVCLGEFVEGDKLRELHRCDHRFHIECIDMWFRDHSTCPLCRSAVEAVKRPPIVGDAAESTEATQVSLPPSDLSSSAWDGLGTSPSSSGETEHRIEVPAARRGFEESAAEQGRLKSPGVAVSAIRRLLSGDLRLYLVGGSSEEPDLERGEAAERPPTTL